MVSASLSEVWLVLRFWGSALWPTIHPAVVLGFGCFGLLWASFFALPSFSGAKSEIRQQATCCQCVLLFADCFSILQLCLTLDVAHWLRRWALCTAIYLTSGTVLSPTHSQPFCLSSLCLLKVCVEISPLLSPLLWCAQSTPPSLLCECSFSVPCLLFSFFFSL
jgi:hypothetical protein